MFFALNSPASSAFAPSSAEATAADGPGKAPEAKRRSTGQHLAARSRLQSSCSPKAPRWTPRGTMARGLRGRAGNPISNLGNLKKLLGIETLRKCLQYLWDCFADGAQIARWSTFKNAAKH